MPAYPATAPRPKYRRQAALFDGEVVERELQARVFDWVRSVDLDALVFHVPNGRKLDRLEAASVRRLGVLAGVADLAVLLPKGRQGWIELKTDRGEQSEEQLHFARRCLVLGHQYGIARSVEEVQRTLLAWGVRWRKREEDSDAD